MSKLLTKITEALKLNEFGWNAGDLRSAPNVTVYLDVARLSSSTATIDVNQSSGHFIFDVDVPKFPGDYDAESAFKTGMEDKITKAIKPIYKKWVKDVEAAVKAAVPEIKPKLRRG